MIERAFQRRTLPLADFGEIGLHGEFGIQKKEARERWTLPGWDLPRRIRKEVSLRAEWGCVA